MIVDGQQIDILQMKVRCLENFYIVKFTMTGFQSYEMKKTNPLDDLLNFWSSAYFYMYLGYKIHNLGIKPGNTHVAVWMNAAKGDYDDKLQWPRACTTTIQLLNQLRDHNHFTKTAE